MTRKRFEVANFTNEQTFTVYDIVSSRPEVRTAIITYVIREFVDLPTMNETNSATPLTSAGLKLKPVFLVGQLQ